MTNWRNTFLLLVPIHPANDTCSDLKRKCLYRMNQVSAAARVLQGGKAWMAGSLLTGPLHMHPPDVVLKLTRGFTYCKNLCFICSLREATPRPDAALLLLLILSSFPAAVLPILLLLPMLLLAVLLLNILPAHC